MNSFGFKSYSKSFLLSAAILIGLHGISPISYAGDRAGNGGSDYESKIASQQALLESTALKIKNFFSIHGATLQKDFPEFKTSTLVRKINESEIRVVDIKTLKDKYGKSRTCLNFPQSNLIECKYSDITTLAQNSQALFVLVFHEYLGLIGVEETSPKDLNAINGYSISKRIAGYVSKVNDYDLNLVSSSCEKKSIEMINYIAPNLDDTSSNTLTSAERLMSIANSCDTPKIRLAILQVFSQSIIESISNPTLAIAGKIPALCKNDKACALAAIGILSKAITPDISNPTVAIAKVIQTITQNAPDQSVKEKAISVISQCISSSSRPTNDCLDIMEEINQL